MAHPHQNLRQHKVEHSRVGRMTRGYATGGAGPIADAGGPATKKAIKQRDAQAVTGKPPRERMDRPGRANGGRVKKGQTTVNVIVAPKEQEAPAMPPVAGMGVAPPMAPKPPMPAPPPIAAGPPPGGPPMPVPGMGAPGAPPIRRHGGRTYATGGAVKAKDGPAFKEGRRLGTPVQHAGNKDDTKDIGRGKPVTYKTGGAIEAPKGKKGMAPHMPGGGRGGLARLAKAHRAAGKHA